MMRSDTPTRALGSLGTTLGLASLLTVVSCSGGGSDDGGGGTSGGSSSGMFVETCSLGCSSGQGGTSVNCTIDSIKQNQQITIVFSQPVDFTSVNSTTFQVLNVATGAAPLGSFEVDAANPRKLIFRPALTFDTTGQLVLGFVAGETYRLTIPGSSTDAGPYIRSTSGRPNKSRLRCDVQPNGIADVVPGNPTVEIFVDVQLFDGMGNPSGILHNQPAGGASDVSQNSAVKMVFADIMNPLTLFNPSTGSSNFIQVNIDRDGNPATIADQSPLAGTFSIFLDQALSRTQLDFKPNCIPGPGLSGRQIIVRFLPGVADLAGNLMTTPPVTVFTAEGATASGVTLPTGGEDFTDLSNFDGPRSSANMWAGDGRVVRGFGGGSGRLGVLRVRDGETVVLDTDMQTFPAASFPSPGVENDIVSNLIPGVDYDPLNQSAWPKIVVTDGVFEFSSVDIEQGGTLVIEGSNPAVLLSRGPANVNGRIDLSGESAPMQLGNVPFSSITLGGANAGNGGEGGTRYDASAFLAGAIQGEATPINLTCGAMDTMCTVPIPPPGDTCCLDIVEQMDGQMGQEVGLGIPPSDGPPPTDSNGKGGLHWPTEFPISGGFGGGNGWKDMFVDDSTPEATCDCKQVGGPGGGGGYTLDGGAGVPVTLPEADGNFDPLNVPATTAGGLAVGLEPANPQSEHFIRKLSPERGFLRGGSSGGGGGTNLFSTRAGTGTQGDFPCTTQNIFTFFDNSGASGGAGGGGIQVTSGASLTILGQIDASGGDGGSASALPPSETNNLDRRNVTPGGGGSGGSIRLQAVKVDILDAGGRIDVRGGSGGTGVAGSEGGAGSRGLARMEQPPFVQMDMMQAISRETEREKVEPFDDADPIDSELHLSIGRWSEPRSRPESFSGVTSCWMQAAVTGCFLELAFEEDDDMGTPGDPSDDTFGWNMDVIYDDGSGEQIFPYRGIPNDPNFPLLDSIENTTGNVLGAGLPVGQGSLFVVRFQGAQSLELQLLDPCDVELIGASSEIIPTSLTPWVSNPQLLNDFVPVPNMIRFSIIYDRTLVLPNTFNDFIKGVTNLRINAIPD